MDAVTKSPEGLAATHEMDLARLEAKVDALSVKLDELLLAKRKQSELIDEMMPIGREVMKVASARLTDLEKKGYFAFGNAMVDVADRVVSSYTADDVRELGDNIVTILDTVRSVTQPEVLDMAREAASAIESADEAEPTGLMGMLKASHDDEVRRGMAVLLEVLRHVGRGAHAIGKGGPRERRPKPVLTKKGRDLSAILGPRGMVASRAAPAPRAPTRAAAPAATAPVAAPRPAATAPAAIPGVAFTPDGFLADADVWTRDIGTAIAAQAGIALSDEHWAVIDWARGDFLQYGASPNVRRITIGTGVPTKDIYRLFPKAPGTTIARIAGIKKPVGCI